MSTDTYNPETRKVETTKLLKKSHIVPDEMWKPNNIFPVNVYDGNVYISGIVVSDTNKAFFIRFYHIPPDACIELITYNWQPVGFNLIMVENGENTISGDAEFYAKLPVTLENALKLCDTASDDSDDIDSIYFYYNEDLNDSYVKSYIDSTKSSLSLSD